MDNQRRTWSSRNSSPSGDCFTRKESLFVLWAAAITVIKTLFLLVLPSCSFSFNYLTFSSPLIKFGWLFYQPVSQRKKNKLELGRVASKAANFVVVVAHKRM